MSLTQRRYVRAPVHRGALYVDDGVLLSGVVKNISYGGVLIGDLPLLPTTKNLSIYFEFPQVEKLSKYNWNYMPLGAFKYSSEIVFAQISIVRSFSKQNYLSAIFENVGAEWVNPSEEFLQKIENYVEIIKANLKFVLSFFEEGREEENEELVFFLANLCGVKKCDSLNTLRVKLMHDFQTISAL